jgi:hypothetical protein
MTSVDPVAVTLARAVWPGRETNSAATERSGQGRNGPRPEPGSPVVGLIHVMHLQNGLEEQTKAPRTKMRSWTKEGGHGGTDHRGCAPLALRSF